jgi:pyridoxal phosphate enzyme (YggS family)
MSAAEATLSHDAAARLAALHARVSAAARAAGREPEAITLVAVSKTQEAARILPLIAAGQRVFGESRVQEAHGKWPALKAAHPGLELHMIGPLQTNKVRDALQIFDVIESVDRERLARKIAAEAQALGRTPRIFVQVNTGEEPQKAGIAPD